MERHAGKMSGLAQDEARALYPEPAFFNPYQPFAETGEGDWQVYHRAGQALFHLLHAPPGKDLVVPHRGTLPITLYALLGIAPHPNSQGPRLRLSRSAFCRVPSYPPT